MKSFAKKGFTLIELMIVIVILGVLMSTVLPKLTGAQARARDTGRKADLGNISQALTTFFSDYGTYPTSGGGCIDGAAVTSKIDGINLDNVTLASLLKGSKLPRDPQTENTAGGCIGGYYYKSITKSSTTDASYILCAHMETATQTNASISAVTATTDYAAASPLVGAAVAAGPAAGYCLLGE